MRDTRRVPALTITVAACTAAVSVVGLAAHDVLEHLQRRPGELRDGQVWRLVTSLFVHDSWFALVANLVLLLIVGIAAERRITRIGWAVLYVAGGVVGQLVGLAWQPHGAGNSGACFGVAGALVVLAAVAHDDVAPWSLGYAAVVLALLLANDIGGAAGTALSIVAVVSPGVVVQIVRRNPRLPLSRALACVALALGVALTTAQDIHGPALLTGVVIAALVLRRRGRSSRPPGDARTAPRPSGRRTRSKH
jgi:membrane associated rhomboid family serine protease